MAYWQFTRRERRALWVSGALIVAALAVMTFWRREPLVLQWVARDDAAVADYRPGSKPSPERAAREARQALEQPEEGEGASAENVPVRLPTALFNPNTADESALRDAGLPPRVVKAILNYRSRGGKFHVRADLRKIYSMNDTVYARVERWIDLPEALPAREKRFVRVDVNRATPEMWQALPGIGAGWAGRICRFRDALGGFSTVEQVAETHGLPDSVFQRILPLLDLEEGPRGWKINLLEADSLARHPYINRKQASILVHYRRNHGPYRDAGAVARSMAFSPEELDRVRPYLDFVTEGNAADQPATR